MICQRPECPNLVIPPRRKYCSKYCSGLVHRVRETKRQTGYKAQALKMNKNKPAQRTCLGKLGNGMLCGKTFASSGPWNRFCPDCLGRRGDAPRPRVRRITADIEASEAEPE